MAWGLAADARAQEALSIVAQADKAVYVLDEPIKLTVLLENTSNVPIRIPQVSRLSMAEMAFLYFEVVGPAGVTRRKSVRNYVHRVYDESYAGAPLMPGASIQLFHYPAITNVEVDEYGAQLGWATNVNTFRASGVYELRVVYHARPEFTSLHGAEDGSRRWVSNTIELVIREPDATEREILETLWHCDPAGEGGVGLTRNDLDELRASINRYPTHPLTRHSLFALGRLSYAESVEASDGAAASRAIEVLSELTDRYPTFRGEEAALFLAKSLLSAGDDAGAAETLSALFRDKPVLWTNWPFVVAAARLTPEPGRSLNEWQKGELRRGAYAVPMEQMRSTWVDR